MLRAPSAPTLSFSSVILAPIPAPASALGCFNRRPHVLLAVALDRRDCSSRSIVS